MDGHRTGAVYDLRKIYRSGTSKEDGGVSELVQLMEDPEVNWIMADSSDGFDVPRKGGVEFYQLLLSNWLGKRLCKNLVSTLELLQRTEWKRYQKAIETLVPQEWQERWMKIVGDRKKREWSASRELSVQCDELERKGVKEFEEAVAQEGAVDNHIWRAAWLTGNVDTARQEKKWVKIARLWQEEVAIPCDQAMEGWRREYDEKTKGQAVQKRLMGAIWAEARRNAERLRIARSRELGCARPKESVVWTVEAIEQQARDMETLLAVQGAEDMSPAMIRELRWRLMTDIKRRYDGMTKAAVAPVWRSRSELPVQEDARQQDKAFNAKPNMENKEGSAGRAVVTPNVKVEKEDWKRRPDRIMPALHSGARQRGEDKRPLVEKGMPSEGQKSESILQRKKGDGKWSREQSVSDVDDRSDESCYDSSSTEESERERKSRDHHKAKRHRPDMDRPLRSDPSAKGQTEKGQGDRKGRVVKPEKEKRMTEKEIDEALKGVEKRAAARQRERLEDERITRLADLSAKRAVKVASSSGTRDDRKDDHKRSYQGDTKDERRDQSGKRGRSAEKHRHHGQQRDYRH